VCSSDLKAVLGMTGTDRQIEKDVRAHYEGFGAHKFRSYWFELWDFYEDKRGKAPPAHIVLSDQPPVAGELPAGPSQIEKKTAAPKAPQKPTKPRAMGDGDDGDGDGM